MTTVTTVHIDTTELDRIARQLDKKTKTILKGVAFKVEQTAKQMAPIKTGALKNSIYTATEDSNSPPSPIHGESIHRLPTPSGNVVANIGPAVDYGIYVELGRGKEAVTGRGVAAQPYLGPAMEYWFHKINSGELYRELFE